MTTEVENAVTDEIYEVVNSLRDHDFMAEEPMNVHFKSFAERLGREPTEEEKAYFEEQFIEEAEEINGHNASRFC
jgi:hypothetical protein